MKNRNGTEKKVAEYALNVQCSWRITQEYEILVASGDIYLPSKRFNGAEEEFKWDIQGMNRSDERLKEFFKTLKSDIFVWPLFLPEQKFELLRQRRANRPGARISPASRKKSKTVFCKFYRKNCDAE
ncbi:MAG: hypothetical protein M0021_16320 [Clostridia bacterium]|nr:hypothetical protein [Clostridia bacterium]